MRLAGGLMAIAPRATVAALSYFAPPDMSPDDLRHALDAIARGEGARDRILPGTGLDTFTHNGSAPEPVPRAISGAKFLRPVRAVSR